MCIFTGARNKSGEGGGSRSVRDRASAYMDNSVDVDTKARRSSDGPKQNQPPRRPDTSAIFHVIILSCDYSGAPPPL